MVKYLSWDMWEIVNFFCGSKLQRRPSADSKFWLSVCLIVAVQLLGFSSTIRALVSLQSFDIIHAISLFSSFRSQKCFLICVQNIYTAGTRFIIGFSPMLLLGRLLSLCRLFHYVQESKAAQQPVFWFFSVLWRPRVTFDSSIMICKAVKIALLTEHSTPFYPTTYLRLA